MVQVRHKIVVDCALSVPQIEPPQLSAISEQPHYIT